MMGEVEQVRVGDHLFEFGDTPGNGYCYKHQSFACLDTEDVQREIHDAVATEIRNGLSDEE